MFFDGWSDRVLPKTNMFWVVTNIIGNAVDKGNKVMDYMTPFALAPQEDGTFPKDFLGSNHPTFLLVFKQNSSQILVEETQIGCTADIFFPHRNHFYTEFAEKYFSAISGSYDNVPYGTENQRETQSGVLNASFFTYPKENTRELFVRAAELIPSIPKALGDRVFEGGAGYNVVFSEPQDEAWDFETILNTPGKIMEVFNVNVKPGQEETFQQLREPFITLAQNTNNEENVYKFTVNRNMMQPHDPLFFDHTNTALTIAVYSDQSARLKAIADINSMDPGFIEHLGLCHLHSALRQPPPNFLPSIC